MASLFRLNLIDYDLESLMPTQIERLELFLEKNFTEIIFVAGPYSKCDVAVNVRNAIAVGTIINDHKNGHYAVVPHLTHFQHMLFPRPYEYWLSIDQRILSKCTAFFRIPGPSPGADKELLTASDLGLKII